MAGYKQPCRYCDRLIPPESNVCPLCGKVEPLGPLRCPRCRDPVERGWIRCSRCGLSLELLCPHCFESTFFGSYCDRCGRRLVVVCPNRKCGTEQPPLQDVCIRCGQPL